MGGSFEQCALDVATHAFEVVKNTVGVQQPEQLAGVHDMIVTVCGKVRKLETDADIYQIIRRAIVDVFEPKI